jgi:hypothetical protein
MRTSVSRGLTQARGTCGQQCRTLQKCQCGSKHIFARMNQALLTMARAISLCRAFNKAPLPPPPLPPTTLYGLQITRHGYSQPDSRDGDVAPG